MSHQPVAGIVKTKLDELITAIEQELCADGLAMFGQIVHGFDHLLRAAIEAFAPSNSKKLVVILETPGGVVEVVERMVDVMRFH